MTPALPEKDTMIEDVRQQLRFLSQVCDKVAASLAEKDLADVRRRGLILLLRSLFQLRRKWLRIAESEGAMPAAELAGLRREFAQAGLAVCEQQEIALCARLDSPKLPARERCSLINTFCTVLAMSRQLEKEHDRATRGEQAPPTSTAAS